MEKDSDITRYATAPGHIDSNIDHILVPQKLVNCCGTGAVAPVAPSMSDHCLVYFEHFQRLHHLFCAQSTDSPILTEKTWRRKGKSNAKLLAADLLNESKNIQTAHDCVRVATGTQRELGMSLNETVGKHVSVQCLIYNFPSILSARNIRTMSFNQLLDIAKTH